MGRPPTPSAEEALRRLLAEGRTWTSRQLSEALAGTGFALGPRQVRRYLKRLGAGYRRTSSALKHKQDQAKAARAGRVLANLKAKAAAGSIALYYLDECGFSPTLPVGYSWCLTVMREPGPLRGAQGPAGQRPGRLSALRPGAPAGRLHGRADVELPLSTIV